MDRLYGWIRGKVKRGNIRIWGYRKKWQIYTRNGKREGSDRFQGQDKLFWNNFLKLHFFTKIIFEMCFKWSEIDANAKRNMLHAIRNCWKMTSY